MPTLRGLAQALNISAADAFGSANPMKKLTPAGYLQYVAANKLKDKNINSFIDDGTGYLRNVNIRYMPRGTSEGSTVDDCSVDVTPTYQNAVVPATMFRKISIALEDDQVAQYETDALAMVSKGTPATPVMQEVWEQILTQMNGFVAKIDKDLLSVQSVNFGRHISTGSALPKTINFPLNSTNNDLTQGMTGFEADMAANELNPINIQMVGSGLMHNYMLQQRAKGVDNVGLDTSRLLRPTWNYDQYSQSLWGADNVGVFEKDAVAFINPCRFRGSKAGSLGKSYFGTLKIPYNDSLGGNPLANLEFDFQLTYRDCPGDVQVGAFDPSTNLPRNMGRGWTLIIMCNYQQFNIPSNMYATDDRLFGNNGTYLYHVTNV